MVAIKKLCETRGVSRSWLSKMRAEGHLIDGVHVFKKHGKLFIDEDAFDAWVKEENEPVHARTDTVGECISRWKASA